MVQAYRYSAIYCCGASTGKPGAAMEKNQPQMVVLYACQYVDWHYCIIVSCRWTARGPELAVPAIAGRADSQLVFTWGADYQKPASASDAGRLAKVIGYWVLLCSACSK